MITSRLTSKAQTTIPQPVRLALYLSTGGELVYSVDGDRAIVTKAVTPAGTEDPFAAFDEWASGNDERAYVDF